MVIALNTLKKNRLGYSVLDVPGQLMQYCASGVQPWLSLRLSFDIICSVVPNGIFRMRRCPPWVLQDIRLDHKSCPMKAIKQRAFVAMLSRK